MLSAAFLPVLRLKKAKVKKIAKRSQNNIYFEQTVLTCPHILTVSKNENDPIFAQNDKTSEKAIKGDRFCVGMVFVQLLLSLPNSLKK